MDFLIKFFHNKVSRFFHIIIIAIFFGINLGFRGAFIANRLMASDRTPKPKQRNVLLLISDDHGLQIGCYGNPVIQTPNLDWLAEEGVVFTNAFCTAPSCSQCRSSIYTGLFSHTNGQYGLAHLPHDQSTNPWVKSLPGLLNERGYYTGIIGKVHVKPQEVYPFDEQIEWERDAFSLSNNLKEFLTYNPEKPFLLVVGFHDTHPSGGPGKFGQDEPYPGEKKISYSADKVIIPPCLPDIPETRQEMARYYRSVSRLDQHIGYVLKALKESGRENGTLIIYTSDGGPPFPGAKTTLYDVGLNIPLIISSTTIKEEGIINNGMVSHIDILPTILDWVGWEGPFKIESPTYSRPGRLVRFMGLPRRRGSYNLPGHTLLPILENENPVGWDTIYASQNLHQITMYYPMRAVRTRKFKYILNIAYKLEYPIALDLFSSSTWQAILKQSKKTMGLRSVESFRQRPKEELYNIKEDPYEIRNIADDPEYKEVLIEMRNKLRKFQEETDDLWLLRSIEGM